MRYEFSRESDFNHLIDQDLTYYESHGPNEIAEQKTQYPVLLL